VAAKIEKGKRDVKRKGNRSDSANVMKIKGNQAGIQIFNQNNNGE